MTHVALPDDAALRVVLRHTVRTIPRAVLAPDASFRAMQHYTSDRIFGVGIHRTAFQTRRLHAVIAAHRKIRTLAIGVPAPFNLPDSSPINVRRIAILLVASHNTTLATDTFGHVEMEAVLLAGQGSTLRDTRRMGGGWCPALRCHTGTCPGFRGHQKVGALFLRSFKQG